MLIVNHFELTRFGIPKVSHGQLIRIGHKMFTAGSVVGYALANESDPYEAIKRNQANGGRDRWIGGNCVTISASEYFRGRDAAERESALVLNYGDVLVFEGRAFTLRQMRGNPDQTVLEHIHDETVVKMIADLFAGRTQVTA